MSVFLKLWGGRQLYIERDRWSTAARFLEWRAHRREVLIWIGSWHIVYTPAGWAAPSLSGERILDRWAA